MRKHLRKPLLFIEMLLLFIGVPSLILIFPKIPRIPLLVLITVGVLLYLRKAQELWSSAKDWPKAWKYLKKVLPVRLPIIAIVLLLIAYVFSPQTLFDMPTKRTDLWLILIVAYPLLSVLPQELLYRGLFFRRYAVLFPKFSLIFVNAVLFSFLHLIYRNPFAVIFTFIGGFVFAKTYKDSGSLLASSIEHGLYGVLLLTIGFATYFYY